MRRQGSNKCLNDQLCTLYELLQLLASATTSSPIGLQQRIKPRPRFDSQGAPVLASPRIHQLLTMEQDGPFVW